MLNIALFGPPGAGKGTQAKFLIDKFNLYHISTGDILRKEMANKTELGLKAKDIIVGGGLVSDEIIAQIIEKVIKNNTGVNGFLFDGFPRTVAQAHLLQDIMGKLNTSLSLFLNIEVPEDELVNRLILRGKLSGRVDDKEDAIRTRLIEYNNKTLPVFNYFSDKVNCQTINGFQDISKVANDISQLIQI